MWRPTPALVACCLLVGAGCDDGPVADEAAQRIEPHVSAFVEPSDIRIGDGAIIEIAVVTQPDLRLLPFTAPESLTGFEILAVEALPPERRAESWIHRTRVKLRARDVGSFAWPRTNLKLTAADGTTTMLSLESFPLEVRSVLPGYPGRSEPFGARAAPERADESRAMEMLAIGCGVAWILLGFGILARRRGRRTRLLETKPAREPAWTEALGTFDRAAHASEPTDAATALAAGLRRYMGRRFGAITQGFTAEDLAEITPPFAATSRWPIFVSLLLDLDSLRFQPRRPTASQPAVADRVEVLRSRAQAFVEDSIPPETLQ